MVVASWTEQIKEGFEYDVKNLAGVLLPELYEHTEPKREEALVFEQTDECNGLSSRIAITTYVLYTIFHMTESHWNYTELILKQKYFPTWLIKCLFCETETIHYPALKILSNISSQPFDNIIFNLCQEYNLISKLLTFLPPPLDSKSPSKSSKTLKKPLSQFPNPKCSTEACLSISNILISTTDAFTYTLSTPNFLPTITSLLSSPCQDLQYEATTILIQLLKLLDSSSLKTLLSSQFLTDIIDALKNKNMVPKLLVSYVELLSCVFTRNQTMVEEFWELRGLDVIQEWLESSNTDICRVVVRFLREYLKFEEPLEMKEDDEDKMEFYNQFELCN